ncbi:MAG: NAD(P)-dependent glycerol-3-phosphate dehydrogenase [Clostridiales bacterium]|nr:NAD(P)-dependent glycerol-3-phosphate dehydrogenase [Clostridiales bacterium]
MGTIGILGAGTWGMALARMLHNSGKTVTVWSAIEREIDELSEKRVHPNLPGMNIPDGIRFTKQLQEACSGKDILLFAVPSVFVRSTAEKAAAYIPDGQIVVDVAKGIEPDTLLTMTGVIGDVLKKVGKTNVKLVALSGPTHAEEVAQDLPTTIVSACDDIKAAEFVQDIFMNTCMRVYTNSDVLGVELCGAMKNIIALSSGVSLGLGYGDNTKAALITRGMAEITRLGLAMGCREQTFAGLAGIGDLIVTATSVHSRNNRAGQLIGQGYTPEEAIKKVGMVVEGINAIPAAMQLAAMYNVEMPIVSAVHSVVSGKITPADAVKNLMRRDKKDELWRE